VRAFFVGEEGDGLRAPVDAGSNHASFGLSGELAEGNGLHDGIDLVGGEVVQLGDGCCES
jgi:hypothetical protein